jgi:hypothetical protein
LHRSPRRSTIRVIVPPGTRVRTVLSDMFGTVERVHGHDVHSVRTDDGVYPTLLLLGRSLFHVTDEADVPFVVIA